MSRIDTIALGLFIIGLAIIVGFSGNASAWDEEGGYAEGEYVTIEWSDYAYAWLSHKDRESPAWYNPIKQLVLSIGMFFISDHADNDINLTVITTVERWDGDSYEQFPEDHSNIWNVEVEHGTNNSVVHDYALDPIQDYFNNNASLVEDFVTREDDSEHPDIFNVSISINGGGTDVEDYGYTTLDDDDLEEISDEINNPDYGFALEGRGSDGGSGSIYEGVDMYGGTGDETGMGMGFGWIFFGLIPIIFIFAVFKFCRRVLWGDN